MTDNVVYKVDYSDPSYIKEATSESSNKISIRDISLKQKHSIHKCFSEIDLSLVVPWSNYIDWWFRCNKCGTIKYAYDCSDKDNTSAFKFLMDKAGFKYQDKDFLKQVEKFLREVCD